MVEIERYLVTFFMKRKFWTVLPHERVFLIPISLLLPIFVKLIFVIFTERLNKVNNTILKIGSNRAI